MSVRSRLDSWLTRVMGRHFPFPTLTQEQEERKEGQEENQQGDGQEDEGEGAVVLNRLEGSTGYFQLREVGGGRGRNIWSCQAFGQS